MYLIEFKNVSKDYDERVVDGFNFYVKQNEFVTLLGPSGCGKTTLLRMLGGFETLTEGEILFEGKPIQDLPAHKRDINTVFQKYALFPHLNVFDNIAFGLKQKKLPKDQIEAEVTRVLKLIKLEHLRNRKIDQLSGGQAQRIAIARAVVNRPKVLLLDEPLSALDLKLRQDMQYELKDMQSALGITFIFVTHDQEEALTMSDTIVVMNDGKIQQIGSPTDIYNEPKNRFVASFIGESNIISGTYKGNKQVEIFGHTLNCVDEHFKAGEACDVVIRPEDLDIVKESDLKLTVIDTVFKGVHYEVLATYNDFEFVIHTYETPEIGSTICVQVDPYEIHLMKKHEA